MSLDRAIAHGRERRRPYYRSGAFDRSCRPHGACPWCRQNRLHGRQKALAVWEAERRRVVLVGGFWRLVDEGQGCTRVTLNPSRKSSKSRPKIY